jgi:hypothetical protein
MKMQEVLKESETLIPQPKTLYVDVLSYDFNRLMKEFRSEQQVKAKGDRGLVMFYTDEEQKEFEKFLKTRRIPYEDIGTE